MYNTHNYASTSNYRWYVLALAALTHTIVVAIPMMSLPVLFDEIAADLGLSLVQVGWIWGIGSLTGILTSLIGGALGDRFGTRRTLMVGCFLAGLTGALRGFSADFVILAATSFLFGLLPAAIPMSVHKTCGEWFAGQRLGLANGVVSAGMALGFMLGSLLSATVLSPWLGGWRNVLFLYGALSVGMSILWAFTHAAPSVSTSLTGDENKVSLRQSFSYVARLRNVWLLGLAMLGVSACLQGTLGYLPLYLRQIGWPAAAADGALATFHGTSLLATIPLALLSDRLGSRRRVLMVGTLMIAMGVGLISVSGGFLIWGAVMIAGVVRDGFMAILMTLIIEIKGVGAAYAGTAIGLVMVFSRLGSLISPPLGNSLADTNLAYPFVFWAALAFLGVFGFYFVAEGRR